MIKKLRLAIRNDLEAPEEARKFGSGWLSGVGALITSLAGLLLTLSAQFPALFATKELAPLYAWPHFMALVKGLILLGFMLACANLTLRRNKVLGFTAIALVLLTSTLTQIQDTTILRQSPLPLGLDWFILNILMTGVLFIPLEKLFSRLTDQPLFRTEWREDLFYFLLSSLLVQSLTFFTLAPSMTILQHTASWSALRQLVAAQPIWLQVLEIMFLTDFVQYWFHRAFPSNPIFVGFSFGSSFGTKNGLVGWISYAHR